MKWQTWEGVPAKLTGAEEVKHVDGPIACPVCEHPAPRAVRGPLGVLR